MGVFIYRGIGAVKRALNIYGLRYASGQQVFGGIFRNIADPYTRVRPTYEKILHSQPVTRWRICRQYWVYSIE